MLGLARQGNAGLATRHPHLLEEWALDLADTEALAAWAEGDTLARFAAEAETLLLINNAGMLQPVGPVPTQAGVQVARAVSLNVAAPLLLTAAVARVRAGRPLRVLHVSSGAGRSAYPGWSVYCATKAALDHHARAVALDRSPGLAICSLAPGVIDTDMQAEIRATPVEKFPPKERFVALKSDGALASPEAAAGRLVDYLLSDGFGANPVADLRELAGG